MERGNHGDGLAGKMEAKERVEAEVAAEASGPTLPKLVGLNVSRGCYQANVLTDPLVLLTILLRMVVIQIIFPNLRRL
eukprot:343877-Karenia_brevis.AAC.1